MKYLFYSDKMFGFSTIKNVMSDHRKQDISERKLHNAGRIYA